MSRTLEDVRQKFPNCKYAPREGCRFCDGTGEKKTHPRLPCICIYIAHDMADFAAESLAETAKKIRQEMGLTPKDSTP